MQFEDCQSNSGRGACGTDKAGSKCCIARIRLRYFGFRILFFNQTLQSEREMCFPKRCRAQACFQEALSEVVLSLVARGAHGSAIAQWRAAASPRFHLRAICGKKIIGIRKIASAFLYCAFLFFGEQNWSSPKCPPRFYFPRFFLGRVFWGFTKIASAFLFSAFFSCQGHFWVHRNRLRVF